MSIIKEQFDITMEWLAGLTPEQRRFVASVIKQSVWTIEKIRDGRTPNPRISTLDSLINCRNLMIGNAEPFFSKKNQSRQSFKNNTASPKCDSSGVGC